MDVNFFSAAYPTYYALRDLIARKGLIACHPRHRRTSKSLLLDVHLLICNQKYHLS